MNTLIKNIVKHRPMNRGHAGREGESIFTVNNILGKNDFDTERIKVVFNSKKVTDHHAIIV